MHLLPCCRDEKRLGHRLQSFEVVIELPNAKSENAAIPKYLDTDFTNVKTSLEVFDWSQRQFCAAYSTAGRLAISEFAGSAPFALESSISSALPAPGRWRPIWRSFSTADRCRELRIGAGTV
jgi:hypothetical protein